MTILIVLCFQIVLSIQFAKSVDSSRILVAAPFGSRSHKNVYVPLVKELVRRGHQITVITNIPTPDFQSLSVREICIKELDLDFSKFGTSLESVFSAFGWLKNIFVDLPQFGSFNRFLAENTYSHPEVQELLKSNEIFDLVLVAETSEIIAYPIAWRFKAPFIVIGRNVVMPGVGPRLGDRDYLSYIPFVKLPFTGQMSFIERALNVLYTKYYYFVSYYNSLDDVRSIVKRLALPDCPPINEIDRNISLYFANSHPVLNYPHPMSPQIIEVGGMHCRPASPLTDIKLEKFISESDEGFVLFAVGSIFNMEDMPDHIMNAFIETFSHLPHRIIWQWKGQIPHELPSNVIAIPWLPQQDLLGHRGCKAFISHGGLNSLQEAVYHGVPVLGHAFGVDQHCNLKKASSQGYAIKLDWTEINTQNLNNSLRQLLYNTTYKRTAEKLSHLFRDQLQTPLERAVFWTEYVIRHDGVDHLRLGSRNLTPFQRSLTDVYLVLFTLFFVAPAIAFIFCFRKCCKHRSSLHRRYMKGNKKE